MNIHAVERKHTLNESDLLVGMAKTVFEFLGPAAEKTTLSPRCLQKLYRRNYKDHARALRVNSIFGFMYSEKRGELAAERAWQDTLRMLELTQQHNLQAVGSLLAAAQLASTRMLGAWTQRQPQPLALPSLQSQDLGEELELLYQEANDHEGL